MPFVRDIAAEVVEVPLRQTFATARDTLARQVSRPVVIGLRLDDGRIAHGEAVAVQYVTGETPETVLRDVDAARDALLGADVRAVRRTVRLVHEALPHSPTARAGLEMALYDAWSLALDAPLSSLLGGALDSVATDITLPIVPDVVDRAKEAAARGFRVFKVKVGGADREDEFARLLALHEALPGARFRLDGNQGYDAPAALELIRRVLAAGLPIELVEQPVPRDDLAALDAVAGASPVPIVADEAVMSPTDALRLIRETRVQGLNVKLMKSGIAGALDIIAIARAAGRRLMIGCMLETRRGIAASLAVACGTGAFDYVDLDSHVLLREEGENRFFDAAGPTLSVLRA